MAISEIRPSLSTLSYPTQSLTGEGGDASTALDLSEGEKSTSLTPLAQFFISSEIRDLTINQEKTEFVYNKTDNSVALKAHSQTDIRVHEEVYNFEITLSAEALGLTAKDFEGNKPWVMKFSYQEQEIHYSRQKSLQIHKRIREPYEVLSDLVSALREVFKDQGNKTVAYQLDEEARQALMSDSNVLLALNQIVMMMAMINLAKKAGDVRHYTIGVSGKANPLVEYEEKTALDSQSRTVNFSITINPPDSTAAPALTAETAPETVDVAV
jgi:hypothetical protein